MVRVPVAEPPATTVMTPFGRPAAGAGSTAKLIVPAPDAESVGVAMWMWLACDCGVHWHPLPVEIVTDSVPPDPLTVTNSRDKLKSHALPTMSACSASATELSLLRTRM